MTGDGAVVREWTEAEGPFAGGAATREHNAALRYLRAEIERLTRERDALGNAIVGLEARTADLLKALKPFAALDVSEMQPDPARGTYLIEQGAIRNARTALAAAKGGDGMSDAVKCMAMWGTRWCLRCGHFIKRHDQNCIAAKEPKP